MKFRLIYPRWEKLKEQTTFNLPPHGPAVMAAALPDYVEVDFIDDNLESFSYDDPVDFVGISMMLTTQAKRGWAIADEYRKRGVKVIFGGISAMLHAEETLEHADSLFLGEAEGRMDQIFNDFRTGDLKKVYNYLNDLPPIEIVGPARRSIYKRDLYYYKGVQMVDLVHASRGCRFSCYPCAVSYLGGRKFRPRPIDKAIEEMALTGNNRLFVVDNSLAQDTDWEMELFREMIPLKKNWCCHTIEDKPEVLDCARRAGAWYVYQAIFDTSDFIRERIKRYHDHDIAVEGTILLGMDNHDEDYIKRLIDFLLDIRLDLAEFTVLTPFPHTKAYDDMRKQKRIFNHDWNDYNAGKVVFYPKQMTPARLQELYYYAWEKFYEDEPQQYKMFKLLKKAIEREMASGTYKPRRRDLMRRVFADTL
ncbi:MAG: radical SAM protein [Spirochaetes bacterium RBG_16_49_21]|nr:MAG: radical SAM protein [Spirochaetes bacterium RBG_16_49_21]